MKRYFVYILGNNRPTLYIGITSNLIRRVWEHKQLVVDGFTKRYRLTKLLYFEEYLDPQQAIQREKQLKHWNRAWKLGLIGSTNPKFLDLYSSLI